MTCRDTNEAHIDPVKCPRRKEKAERSQNYECE
jgi:hypothetical protein